MVPAAVGTADVREEGCAEAVLEHATWCNTVGFAGVQYFNPYWRVQPQPSASDWIDARWEFETGPNGDFG